MSDAEIASNYEVNTGHAIVRAFDGVDPSAIPAVLVANHGAFAWGDDPAASAHHAVILESIARMAYFTLGINQQAPAIGRALHDQHYLRKHGKAAYYGQAKQPKERK
jgi:L-ribulose-5-phosphate 4-epimerase